MKKGMLCHDCYKKLPRSVQKNLTHYSFREVHQILNAASSIREGCFFKVGKFYFSDHTIRVGNFWIDVKNFQSVKLNFHNRRPPENGKMWGIPTIQIVTKSSRVAIEEAIFDERTVIKVDYRIDNKKAVTILYPIKLVVIMRLVQKALQLNMQDFTQVHEEYYKFLLKQKEREEKRRQEEEREKEERRREEWRQEEVRRKEGERQEQKREEERRRAEERRRQAYSQSRNQTAFEIANYYFKMARPFTIADLKKRRRALMKAYHPDAGGTNEQATSINKDFDVLKQYAS